MPNELEFERPIGQIRAKIEQLHKFMADSDVDLTTQIEQLEQQLEEQSKSIYEGLTPWQRVQVARQAGRPTTLDYIKGMCTDFVELHGDRNFRDDPAIVGGIGVMDGQPVTLIGHQKGRDTKENIYRNFGMAHPEGYRKALRLMKQAEKFHRPVIIFIDTAGAYPGMSAEERGQSEAIATNLREMAGLKTPTICFVTGEGGSGGALGLGVTDKIFVLEYAWYSVISPESAAAILWKDSTQGPRAAETMRIGAKDLMELGVADQVIPEPPGGAQKDPNLMIQTVKQMARESLDELNKLPIPELLDNRYNKYRNIGSYAEE